MGEMACLIRSSSHSSSLLYGLPEQESEGWLADLMIRSTISSTSCESDHMKLLPIAEGKSKLDYFKDYDICGLVFACADSRARLILIDLNKSDKQQFRRISVAFPNNLTTDFSVGWSFTILDSKLFATGGRAKHVNNHKKGYYDYGFHVREVYFCDLQDAFADNIWDDGGEPWLEFKVAATLNCPKRSPLVVPYKDKIFFIANPCEEGDKLVNTPCEILHLGEFNHVKPLASPKFWQGHDPTREDTFLNGHVVVRNKLYVRVLSTNNALPTLYCLDMDAELWEAEECVCIPHILKDAVHEGDNNRPWNYVHGNKLFKLEMDEEDSTFFSFSVEILIKDDHDHDVGKVEVDLKCVVDSMGLQGRYYIFDGWVLPCEEEKTSTDVFCLMFSVADLIKRMDRYFCLCKFRLTDDCTVNILTRRAIYVLIPRFFGRLMIGFTPGITKALNKGAYSTKLIYRDAALERKKREEAKRADPNREEAEREYKRREDARREAAKARREAAKREAAKREDANRELKVERLYLRHVEWALEDEFLDSEEEPTFSSEEEE
ncbi:hypothetical protein LINGRAHAP2_LOCUS35958 [Linum grandiflorum]